MEKIRGLLDKISPIRKALALGILAFNPHVSGENVIEKTQKINDSTKNTIEAITDTTKSVDKSNIEWVEDSLEKKNLLRKLSSKLWTTQMHGNLLDMETVNILYIIQKNFMMEEISRHRLELQ